MKIDFFVAGGSIRTERAEIAVIYGRNLKLSKNEIPALRGPLPKSSRSTIISVVGISNNGATYLYR